MIYLDIILKSLGILSLLTFIIIFIWGFIVFKGIHNQMRYTNYLLEKISHILNIQDENQRFNNKFTTTENEPSSANISKAEETETSNNEN